MNFHINETADDGYCPYQILLDDTNELNEIADRIQKAKGELPLFDYSGEYEGEDWYDFYLECDGNKVIALRFEYGWSGTRGGYIELTDEDKIKAYEEICKFFGSVEDYKEYIRRYEEGH